MSSSPWSAWTLNENLSNQDSLNWHVYRARRSSAGQWEYDTSRYPRQLFPHSQQLILYLRDRILGRGQNGGQNAASATPTDNVTNQDQEGGDEDNDDDNDDDDEQSTGSEASSSIQSQFENLGIGSNNPFSGQRSTTSQLGYDNNPFRNSTGYPSSQPSTTADPRYNPFQNHQNYPHQYPGQNLPRATTPQPTSNTRHSQSSNGYQPTHGGFSSGAIPSASIASAHGHVRPQSSMGHSRHGSSRRHGHNQSASSKHDSRQSTKAPTVPPERSFSLSVRPERQSRNQAERSHAPPNTKGFKSVKPKDQRKFFKAGAVFKAFWQQSSGEVPGMTNPFGEIVRFVVLRPHKRHSICLAIHTYQNQGTTARHASPRDHIVIYSTERPPVLVPGEDQIILKRDPIRVTLDTKGEPLMPTSRLSLGKLYTVEHNIPTYPLGKISSRDVDKLKVYCTEVQGLFVASSKGAQGLPDVGEDEEEDEED